MSPEWTLSPEVEQVIPEVIATRRDLHQHPELGYQERRTAGIVAERLRALGVPVRTGIAETGVVGLVRGHHEGATVMLRADMDALPLQEATGLPYASQTPGVMHACGHDGHTAMLLGAARVLAETRDQLRGCVKLVFQPAEESYGGAQRLVEAGVLRDPEVSAAFGLHLWNTLPLGTVGITAGPAMASTDSFTLTLRGKGGHAAAPHQAADPVVAAAHFVVAAQSVVSRTADPLRPAVFTIGAIHGGEAANIIPEEVVLRGTLRTLDADTRARLVERIRAVLMGTAAAHGVSGIVDHRRGYPCLVNDESACALARAAAASVVGASHVVAPHPTMGGEDMAYYLQVVPGCYLWLGSASSADGAGVPHHNPRFQFDERALGIGVEILVRLARQFLEQAAAG
ncbi:MAG: amidohydrolase [Armatimonadetes bacterium]|nr:amidohydrolase [Armatimonadota bacterium]